MSVQSALIHIGSWRSWTLYAEWIFKWCSIENNFFLYINTLPNAFIQTQKQL